MIGKKLDSTWKAYATNSIRDYLERHAIIDNRVRLKIIDQAITRYIEHLPQEHRLTFEDVNNMKQHNGNLQGVIDQTVWCNLFTWHKKISLSENTNGSSLAQNSYSTPEVILAASPGGGSNH